jgi:hypothetical protein
MLGCETTVDDVGTEERVVSEDVVRSRWSLVLLLSVLLSIDGVVVVPISLPIIDNKFGKFCSVDDPS